MNVILAVLILCLVILVTIFWSSRVAALWRVARELSGQGRWSRAADWEVEVAWRAVVRDSALGILSVGLLGYIFLLLAQSGIQDVLGSLSPGVRTDGQPKVPPSVSAESLLMALVRISLSIASFCVVATLVYAFVPGLLPVRRGSWLSNLAAGAMAISFGSFFALWIALPSQNSDALIAGIGSGFRGIFTTFVSVLIMAITVYLAWKEIWRRIKPK